MKVKNILTIRGYVLLVVIASMFFGTLRHIALIVDEKLVDVHVMNKYLPDGRKMVVIHVKFRYHLSPQGGYYDSTLGETYVDIEPFGSVDAVDDLLAGKCYLANVHQRDVYFVGSARCELTTEFENKFEDLVRHLRKDGIDVLDLRQGDFARSPRAETSGAITSIEVTWRQNVLEWQASVHDRTIPQ